MTKGERVIAETGWGLLELHRPLLAHIHIFGPRGTTSESWEYGKPAHPLYYPWLQYLMAEIKLERRYETAWAKVSA